MTQIEKTKTIITSDMLSKYKDSFKKQIKGPFASYVKEDETAPLDIKNINIFTAAVAQGYDDAKRTFTGIGDIWESFSTEDNTPTNELPNQNRDAFFEIIARKIQSLFTNPRENFDEWHYETCNLFINTLKKKNYEATYGQAQKVINMAFKYLYCLYGADSKEYCTVFDKCHMPLDSYTLEWISRVIYPWYNEGKKRNEKLTASKTPTWSNFNGPNQVELQNNDIDDNGKYFYTFITSHIAQYFRENSDCNPFQAEFVIWPQIQLELATESFYAQTIRYLDDEEQKSKKQKFRGEPLANKCKFVAEKCNVLEEMLKKEQVH